MTDGEALEGMEPQPPLGEEDVLLDEPGEEETVEPMGDTPDDDDEAEPS